MCKRLRRAAQAAVAGNMRRLHGQDNRHVTVVGKTKMNDHVKIIDAGPEHRNFILKTFAIEYSKIHHISKNQAAAKMGILLDSWKTAIATVDGAGNEIMGFLVYRDRGMLAWLYVKHLYRRHGVARALLTHADVWPGAVDVAFFSSHAAKIAKEGGLALRWRPYEPDTEAEKWGNVERLLNAMLAESKEAEQSE